MFQAAARKAIASVVFSRIVMASPGMCEFNNYINYSCLPLQLVANKQAASNLLVEYIIINYKQ